MSSSHIITIPKRGSHYIVEYNEEYYLIHDETKLKNINANLYYIKSIVTQINEAELKNTDSFVFLWSFIPVSRKFWSSKFGHKYAIQHAIGYRIYDQIYPILGYIDYHRLCNGCRQNASSFIERCPGGMLSAPTKFNIDIIRFMEEFNNNPEQFSSNSQIFRLNNPQRLNYYQPSDFGSRHQASSELFRYSSPYNNSEHINQPSDFGSRHQASSELFRYRSPYNNSEHINQPSDFGSRHRASSELFRYSSPYNNSEHINQRRPSTRTERRLIDPRYIIYSPRYGLVDRRMYPNEIDLQQYKTPKKTEAEEYEQNILQRVLEESKTLEQKYEEHIDKIIKMFKFKHLKCNVDVLYNIKKNEYNYTVDITEETIPEEEAIQCYICRDDIDGDDIEKNEIDGTYNIVAPCPECHGSVGLMHRDCYLNSIRHKTVQCGVCKKNNYIIPSLIDKHTEKVLTEKYPVFIKK